jgi:D-3-phosphoglycerate dehydrogenase
LYDNRPESADEQIRRVQHAEVIINTRGQVKWPGDVLRQLPKLRLATVCGIGTDAFDLDTARELGITVCNIPGRTAPVVAEHAFALMLALSRRTAWFTAAMKLGRWPRMLATSLVGKTLGVIGTGNIGCEMIRLSRGFGMNVVAWSFHPSEEKAERLGFAYVELDQLLNASDVVSLHIKLTDDSRALIGARELGLMKPGSLLVNTARGAVVDRDALIAALDSGHLAGAALDVFDVEPLPADDPLLECEHLVLTPHCADQTPEGIELLNTGCVDNVIAFLEGRPQNVVT